MANTTTTRGTAKKKTGVWAAKGGKKTTKAMPKKAAKKSSPKKVAKKVM